MWGWCWGWGGLVFEVMGGDRGRGLLEGRRVDFMFVEGVWGFVFGCFCCVCG